MRAAAVVLAAAGVVASSVSSGATQRVLSPPSPGGSSIDPYAYLNGGGFTGPALPFTPDPLARYQWDSSVNKSELQVRDDPGARLTMVHQAI